MTIGKANSTNATPYGSNRPGCGDNSGEGINSSGSECNSQNAK